MKRVFQSVLVVGSISSTARVNSKAWDIFKNVIGISPEFVKCK